MKSVFFFSLLFQYSLAMASNDAADFRNHSRKILHLGICIGENLAQQAQQGLIRLPSPGQGTSTLDEASRASFKIGYQSALQACRAASAPALPPATSEPPPTEAPVPTPPAIGA